MDTFDHLLDTTLRSRSAATPPVGLEQRLLAHLANEPRTVRSSALSSSLNSSALGSGLVPTRLFTTSDRINTRRSPASLWTAIAAHAAVFLLLFTIAASHVQLLKSAQTKLTSLEVLPPPPLAPRLEKLGGGGGQHGPTPVTVGHLPKLAQEQIVPPKAPPLIEAKLAVEPTVIVQPNLKMADNKMPDLGMPNSNLKGFSMGNGNGSGIGSGDGSGIGPGSGGNIGGGVFHIGGSIRPPAVLYSVEPEFSEEARKAKFSGNVQVYLWVDEHGNPSHVRIARGVGMGLDEKAIEAVRQYKFKPATQNGKPVKVDLYVDVNFQIF
jgi:protein TonB